VSLHCGSQASLSTTQKDNSSGDENDKLQGKRKAKECSFKVSFSKRDKKFSFENEAIGRAFWDVVAIERFSINWMSKVIRQLRLVLVLV